MRELGPKRGRVPELAARAVAAFLLEHTRTAHSQHVRVRRERLGSRRRAHLCCEEEVDARKQRPAEPPQHVGPVGSEDAALETPAPLALGPAAHALVVAARSLQHASKASTHMPIVPHEDMHAERHAMSKQQQQHNVQQSW